CTSNPQLQFSNITDQHIQTDSYAIYGEATYAFAPKFKLIAGARETWERKAGHSPVDYTNKAPVCSVPPPDPSPEDCTDSLFPGSATYSHTWDAFTPKLVLSYQPDDDLYLYTSAVRGFKSGGYDLSGAAGSSTPAVNALLAK